MHLFCIEHDVYDLKTVTNNKEKCKCANNSHCSYFIWKRLNVGKQRLLECISAKLSETESYEYEWTIPAMGKMSTEFELYISTIQSNRRPCHQKQHITFMSEFPRVLNFGGVWKVFVFVRIVTRHCACSFKRLRIQWATAWFFKSTTIRSSRFVIVLKQVPHSYRQIFSNIKPKRLWLNGQSHLDVHQ